MNSRPDLAAKRAAFSARTERYLGLGYDRMEAAAFVVKSAGALSGPALDVGTGKGLLAMALAARGLDVVSVDPDGAEQALASLLSGESGLKDRIHFIHGDASRLNYPDGHFGCAAMMDVLHHLNEPGPVITEMARVLRPDGVLVLADFSPEGFDLIEGIHRDEGRVHSVSGVTLGSAGEILLPLGFQYRGRFNGHFHEIDVYRKADEHDPGPQPPSPK
ncbi:class I SAM-dependent methyltransferase [bacterium]|nr:class I SAM-dependent methyltransferase [bacterium]